MMTLNDWIGCAEETALRFELCPFPARKLHLLAAAFLRGVWDQLPSPHSRLAVEATEKFAAGRMSADALAWARSQAARESDETMWLADGSFDDYDLIDPCFCGCSEPRRTRYECRVARQGGILDGARDGIGDPAWVATAAAFHALRLKSPIVARDRTTTEWRGEWRSLFTTAREVLGDDSARPFNPAWRTSDVIALARGIYDDRAFDRLPILADALQDAGCDDSAILSHCRAKLESEHVRGCWAVDLAMGIT